jgi:chromosome segregation ATPase
MRELELRLNEQRNETIRVIEEKGQLEDRTEELEIELSRRANTLDATKEALLSMENSYRDLLSQNNGLKGEMAHLQHDVQSAQSRISDMNITLEQRETDMHRVNMELAEVRTDVTSERNRASLAESKVTRLMKQLEELKSETENDLDRYRSERDIMKVKHDQAQDAVEAIRQRLADTERNRDRALSQVETLRNEIAAHRAEMSTKASSLETSNRELSSHITVLERILEQYRMKPVTSGQSSADAARLRVVAAREGETG